MKGFKGFDKDMKCRGMQYEIGKTYNHNGTVSLCNSGYHFCEHPLDTWNYYKPNESRFGEVEADGVSGETEQDTKRAAKTITVKAEVKIPALLKAAVEFVFSRVNSSPKVQATTGYSAHSATTGNYAHSATTGYSAHSATTGDYAHSATTGDSAHSATTGYSAKSSAMGNNAIAASLGPGGMAKAAKGNWLVLAEYADDGKIKAVGVARIGGKQFKPDTYYKLVDGKFVEAESSLPGSAAPIPPSSYRERKDVAVSHQEEACQKQ